MSGAVKDYSLWFMCFIIEKPIPYHHIHLKQVFCVIIFI